MTSRVVQHIRSNVVAYIALFVALGGTSYAAIKLPANSVGTRQRAESPRCASAARRYIPSGRIPFSPISPRACIPNDANANT